MKAYHYLLAAFAAFLSIPASIINLSRIQSQPLFLVSCLVACLILAFLGFAAFMSFIDIHDQEVSRKRFTCSRVTAAQKFS